jgi:hypothetical protein
MDRKDGDLKRIDNYHPGVVTEILRALVNYKMPREIARLASCSKRWRELILDAVTFTFLRYVEPFRSVTKCVWCSVDPRKENAVLRISDGLDLDRSHEKSNLDLFTPDEDYPTTFELIMHLFDVHRGKTFTISRLTPLVVWSRAHFAWETELKYIGVFRGYLCTWTFKRSGNLHAVYSIDLTPLEVQMRSTSNKRPISWRTSAIVSVDEPEFEDYLDNLPNDLVVLCTKCKTPDIVKRRVAIGGDCLGCPINERSRNAPPETQTKVPYLRNETMRFG